MTTVHIEQMTDEEAARSAKPSGDAGVGTLHTERGNLPLEFLDVQAAITGLVSEIVLRQGFHNPYDLPLEATYIFPLPDRAAVTGMTMTADDRVIRAELRERGEARQQYEQAIAEGKRASIAEEERPDVFTMRVGNILPGERVEIALTLVGPLSYESGEPAPSGAEERGAARPEEGTALFRFPLVVAPRYIPGTPIGDQPVGDGYAEDTDAVPDASRITPPILLPGFPNPVRLSLQVRIDPAGLPLRGVRSSLHVVSTGDGEQPEGTVRLQPGERANRDFVLRLAYGEPDHASSALTIAADAEGDEGTFQLTVLPPAARGTGRPRDLVLLLDRSGSMQGWKMVAARRAAARIVDTLTEADRFAVLAFDDQISRPDDLPAGLVPASDRHRYRAVEHLTRVDARGGTELLAPLQEALKLLARDRTERDRVLVLVTDGQVGNEDQLLREASTQLRQVRVHTVGIDQAVNAGFLGRLAAVGGGRCELVESEDRLDEAMDRIHQRIGSPLVTGLTVSAEDLLVLDDTQAPSRVPDLFPGVPLVVRGRCLATGAGTVGAVTVSGTARDGSPWTERVVAVTSQTGAGKQLALARMWAREHLRDLEDTYVATDSWQHDEQRQALAKRIVETSLRFGVLCRFTAYVAVDSRVVTEGRDPHRVVQPVEPAAGWDMLAAPPMRLMAISAPMPAPRDARARGITLSGRTDGAPAAGGRAAGAPVAGRAGAGRMMRLPKKLRKEEAAPTELADARGQLADELRLLREGQGRPDVERRELLADLASRLDALLRHLRQRGVDETQLAPLVALAAALQAPGPVDDLWAQAVRVLERFEGKGDRRRSFWT